MPDRRPAWVNILFLSVTHAIAVLAIVYLAQVRADPRTLLLGLIWFALTGLSISGGYHRLFAHRSYRASRLLQFPYLAFGAAAVQNSALSWATDHRVHHAYADTEKDPYNIRRGFLWAHVGWVLFKAPEARTEVAVEDLTANRLVTFQHKHYVLMAIVFGALLPAGLGALWGDWVGGLLVGCFLRLVLMWHATFSINSFAHCIGRRPYCTQTSARDSAFTALISFGEGYHNFHHRFQADYRNGVRWYHFDPTKWIVFLLGKVGVTWDIKRTPVDAILRARQSVRNAA